MSALTTYQKSPAPARLLRGALLGAVALLSGCAGSNSTCGVSSAAPTAVTATSTMRDFLSPHQRILDGILDSNNLFPFVVRLQITASNAVADCSGFLIAPTTVLSAAHCVADPELGAIQGIQVLVGGVVINAAGWKYNPAYQPSSQSITDYGVDASLIYLGQTTSVTPAILSTSEPAVGSTVVDVGYGLNGEGSDGNGSLGQRLYGELQIQNDQSPGASPVSPTYVDGIVAAGQRETCEGDSGGPLLTLSNVVVGILSGGDVSGSAGTCQQSTNSIYTSVVNVSSFIQSNLCN